MGLKYETISPFGSEADIEKRRVARIADRAYSTDPNSPHTKLLIQNAVNYGSNESFESDAKHLAEAMSENQLSDKEKWEVKVLRRLAETFGFEDVVSGDVDIEVMSMRRGLHPDWVMISANDAEDAIQTLFSSIRHYEDSRGFLPKQFQQELIGEFADRYFAVEYDPEVRAVDFSDLVSAARSIKKRLNFVDCKLLAWHLGRVPIRRGEDYKDKERFLNQIEEALIEARKELQQNKGSNID